MGVPIFEINQDKLWKYAQCEYERRFLIRQKPPIIERAPYKEITDKYLDNTHLRIRKVRQDGRVQFKLTKKLRLDGVEGGTHWISTIYLSSAEFNLFFGLPGVQYEKRRYYVEDKSGKGIAIDEIDIGQNRFWIAEVEFDNASEMKQYQFGIAFEKELTMDFSYDGLEIARKLSATE